jgi:hypothetical protein
LHLFDQKKLPCQDFLCLSCVRFWHRRVFNSNRREHNGRGWTDQSKVYSQRGYLEKPFEHWIRNE